MSAFTTTPAGFFTVRSTSFVRRFFRPKPGQGIGATYGSAVLPATATAIADAATTAATTTGMSSEVRWASVNPIAAV
jgi:hypothetical protein